jgi:hypothetical protein
VHAIEGFVQALRVRLVLLAVAVPEHREHALAAPGDLHLRRLVGVLKIARRARGLHALEEDQVLRVEELL